MANAALERKAPVERRRACRGPSALASFAPKIQGGPALLKVLGGAFLVLTALSGAAWLALRRGDIPYEALEARYAAPTSRYVDLPGGLRAHYRDDGPRDAPTVLLVHGFGDSFLSWAPWIEILARDFRVVTVDLPGHGLTRAPDAYAPSGAGLVSYIGDFTKALGLRRYAIAGNSMGGGVAWGVALAYPDSLTALVLVNAAGFANETSPPPSLAFRLLGTPIGRFLLETIETRPLTAASLRGNFVDASVVTDAFVERWVAVQRAPGHRPILMRMMGAGAGAQPSELARIKAPTLILWGDKDRLIEVASAHKFAAAIPGAELIIYPDVGHMPQLEIPDRSAADARAFLHRVLARQ